MNDLSIDDKTLATILNALRRRAVLAAFFCFQPRSTADEYITVAGEELPPKKRRLKWH